MPRQPIGPERLGDRIVRIRSSKGWNQEGLADRAGVHRNTLRSIEKNRTQDPDDGTLEKIADALNVELDELVNGAKQQHALPDPSPSGSPAERILYGLGIREGLRRQSRELDDEDVVIVAYMRAFRAKLGVDELRKLDAWRDWLIGNPTH